MFSDDYDRAQSYQESTWMQFTSDGFPNDVGAVGVRMVNPSSWCKTCNCGSTCPGTGTRNCFGDTCIDFLGCGNHEEPLGESVDWESLCWDEEYNHRIGRLIMTHYNASAVEYLNSFNWSPPPTSDEIRRENLAQYRLGPSAHYWAANRTKISGVPATYADTIFSYATSKPWQTTGGAYSHCPVGQ